jgi:putative alpha-1,2-mannosidase
VAKFLSLKNISCTSNHKVIDEAALKVKNFDSIIFDAKNNNRLLVKVAVSSVSIENAKDNLDSDTFEAARIAAEKDWNSSLSKIKLKLL